MSSKCVRRRGRRKITVLLGKNVLKIGVGLFRLYSLDCVRCVRSRITDETLSLSRTRFQIPELWLEEIEIARSTWNTISREGGS